MEFLARLAVKRPVAVTVLATAFTLLGWAAWSDLPVDLLPDVQSPTIVVSLRSGDRPPTEMERIYGEPIEQSLFAVQGIREISQVARTGRIIATVVFEWDADMDVALVDVQKAVSPLSADVDVDELLVRRFDPRQAPVLTVGVMAPTGSPDLAELRRIARRQIAPALERLEGVAETRVLGGRELEVRVDVDPYRLEAQGLTLGELESRVRASNLDVNAGTLEEGGRVLLVRGLARYRSPDDVADAIVMYRQDAGGRRVAVRVRDVAEVSFATSEITHLVRVGGVEGVGLSIYKEAGANTVAVSRTLKEALSELERDLPQLEVSIVADEAGLVEDAISDVEIQALIGVLLTIAVLTLFLRAAGPTVIVSIAVPVSLLTTLFLMLLRGETLNIMTLGGLALGAGMLVDNAIVVVESIFRRLDAGEGRDDAAVSGTAAVAGAIAASTLTTCAVFLPVVFVRGLAARLVEGLAFAVVVSLAVSLVVAVLVIPALARWLLPKPGKRGRDPGEGRLAGIVGALLPRSAIVVLVSLGLVAGAAFALRNLGSELLPPADPRQFSVRLVGPPGQSVEATERVVEIVEDILREAAGDDLVALQSEVGRLPEDDRLIREEQTEENTARILVRISGEGRSADAIVRAASPAVDRLAQLEASWEIGASALASALGTTGPPITIELSGAALPALRQAAEDLRVAMASRDALWNVRSSFEGGPPELRVYLQRTLADGLGIDLDAVTSLLEASLDGRVITTMSTGDEEYDVALRLPEVRREELASLRLTTAQGLKVALGDVARFEPETGAREIFRRDQRRVALVTARIAPGAEYPDARAAAEEALGETALAPGLRARLAGEEEERARTFRQLGLALSFALVLVFMVLAGTFESLLHPLTVLAAAPLAIVGVAAALVPVGKPIGVMALLGLIMLAGIAVNDAILLIETARRLMSEGLPRRQALARAAGIRLRPILMTTTTTVLALAPLAFGAGEAASLRTPLALTVIGGIVASTIGSLFVVPCLYDLLDRLRPGRG